MERHLWRLARLRAGRTALRRDHRCHRRIGDDVGAGLEDDIEAMVRAVVQDGCDTVAIVCTNRRGAGVAARLERELGLPVIDSVAVTLWRSLVMAGYPVDGSSSFGQLFA